MPIQSKTTKMIRSIPVREGSNQREFKHHLTIWVEVLRCQNAEISEGWNLIAQEIGIVLRQGPSHDNSRRNQGLQICIRTTATVQVSVKFTIESLSQRETTSISPTKMCYLWFIKAQAKNSIRPTKSWRPLKNTQISCANSSRTTGHRRNVPSNSLW